MPKPQFVVISLCVAALLASVDSRVCGGEEGQENFLRRSLEALHR